MQEREYLRLKREIHERCRKDLESLERVWQLSIETGGAKKDDATEGIKRGDLQTAILRAIGQFNGNFTAEDMHEKIKETDPEIGAKAKPTSVSSALMRMDGNEIEVIERGVGRKRSVYKVRKTELKAVGA
jgi:hypothetical protein